MNTAELALRTAGLTCAVLLWLLVVAHAGWRRHRAMQLVLACVAGYLLCTAPDRPCATQLWGLLPLAGAVSFSFALWRLSRVVLQDDLSIPVLAWFGLTVLLGSGALAAIEALPVEAGLRQMAGNAHKLTGFAFLAAAVWQAWRSGEGDLVEPRRRLRGWLLCGGAAYGMAVMGVELYLGHDAPPAWLALLNLGLIVGMLGAALLYLAGLRPAAMQVLFDAPPAVAAVPGPAASRDAENPDEPAAQQLVRLMQEQRPYRDPELNVRQLAVQARLPEYVLRRVIHDRLGYRNFAAFVNDYRLQEVTARLGDAAEDRRPILTLALEAGFGSIGPFNRSFRERHGVTPSQYRDQRKPPGSTVMQG